MGHSNPDEIVDFWNRVADDWQIQVGTAGDRNRLLNSDPVLWAFAGDVAGRKVLDAGCGTGYLSKQLQDRGLVIALDEAGGCSHPEAAVPGRGIFHEVLERLGHGGG